MPHKIVQFISNLKKRPIIREFSWYTFANFTAQIFSFISVAFVSRYLGPTNLGLMAFTQNYLAIFSSAVAGMDFYFTWHIVNRENKIEETIKFAIQKTYIILLVFIIGLGFGYFYFPIDVFFLTLILFVPFLLNGLYSFWLYAVSEKRAKLLSLIQIFTALTSLITKISLTQLGLPLKYFIFAAGIDSVINSLIITIIFLFNKNFIHEIAKIKIPKFITSLKLILEIKYNLLLTIFWQIVMRSDQLILAHITTATAVGIYAAGVKITEAPNVLVGILTIVTYPRVAEYVKEIRQKSDETVGRDRLNKVLYTYLFFGICVSVFLFICAPFLIKIMYGNKFLESIPILRIYGLSVPGLFITFYYTSLFGAYEERKLLAFAALYIMILTLILGYILTIRFQILGTAWATTISYTISAFTFRHIYHKMLRIRNITY